MTESTVHNLTFTMSRINPKFLNIKRARISQCILKGKDKNIAKFKMNHML